MSALLWGIDSPEIVFVHGGAQNAHTWDTVALALGRSAVGRRPARSRPLGMARRPRVLTCHERRRHRDRDRAPRLGRGSRRRHVARGTHLDRARRATSRPRAQADARRRHAGRRSRQGQGDHRLRQRSADVPELRRHHEAHRRAQPDAHRGVAAARHPPQRAPARRRIVGVELRPPASRRETARRARATSSIASTPARCGTTCPPSTMPIMLLRGSLSPVVDDTDVAEVKRRQPHGGGRRRRRRRAQHPGRQTPRAGRAHRALRLLTFLRLGSGRALGGGGSRRRPLRGASTSRRAHRPAARRTSRSRRRRTR